MQNTEGVMRRDTTEWLPLIALFMVGVFPNGVLLCAPALGNQLVNEFAFTPEQLGNFFSLEFCGFAVAGILGTYVLPRVNWVKLFNFALFVFVAGYVASIFVLPDVRALMIVQGMTTIFGGCSISLLGLSFSGQVSRPARGYAMFILGQLASGTVGLLVLPWLFQAYGLKAFFVAEVLLALSMVPFIKWLPATPPSARAGNRPQARVPFHLLLLGLGTVTAFYYGLASVWTFIGQIGTGIHLTDASIGTALAISTVAGMIGSVVVGVLSGRVQAALLISAGMGAMLLSCVGLVDVRSLALFTLSAILFKFAWTFALPPMLEAIAQADETSRLLAFSSSGIGVGLMVGPAVAGWIISISKGYTAMLLVAAAMCVFAWLGCLTLVRVNRRATKTGHAGRVVVR
uniref:MFS transporter n=1 Tax=Burkholderia anthina TaxID=179879 RepID=UPI00158A0318|nr:MFS transporter [Burkholderia anthina]